QVVGSQARRSKCGRCGVKGRRLPARDNDVWFECSNSLLLHFNPNRYIKAYRCACWLVCKKLQLEARGRDKQARDGVGAEGAVYRCVGIYVYEVTAWCRCNGLLMDPAGNPAPTDIHYVPFKLGGPCTKGGRQRATKREKETDANFGFKGRGVNSHKQANNKKKRNRLLQATAAQGSHLQAQRLLTHCSAQPKKVRSPTCATPAHLASSRSSYQHKTMKFSMAVSLLFCLALLAAPGLIHGARKLGRQSEGPARSSYQVSRTILQLSGEESSEESSMAQFALAEESSEESSMARRALAEESSEESSMAQFALAEESSEESSMAQFALAEESSEESSMARRALAEESSEESSMAQFALAEESSEESSMARRALAEESSEESSMAQFALAEESSEESSMARRALAEESSEESSMAQFALAEESSEESSMARRALAEESSEESSMAQFALAEESSEESSKAQFALAEESSEESSKAQFALAEECDGGLLPVGLFWSCPSNSGLQYNS
ncbi:hypothetical protein QJQ45_022683, partial [Haematococcus lacustris]